jgi:serine/threonine protein kinase
VKQLIAGLIHLQQTKTFKVGEFTERNIFMSVMFENLYLDPGFYTEKIFFPYFQLPSGEDVSKMSDVYALGLIIFRLATLKKPEEIQAYFNDPPESRRKSINQMISPLLISKNDLYYQNIKAECAKLTVILCNIHF